MARVTQPKRKGPAGNGTSSEDQAGGRSTAILPDPTDVARLATLSGYVIRTVTTMTNGRAKTQHYASLHAASRAKERAEARGCVAVLTLCRVAPVGIITEDELAEIAAGLVGGGR